MNATLTDNEPPTQLSSQQLEQAFAAFNRVSDELGSTWKELEERVAHLSQELASTRSARLQELAEKKRIADKLTTLMEALPGAVVVINAAGLIEEANPAAEAIFGSDLRNRDWGRVLATCTETPLDGNGEFDSFDQRRFVLAYSHLADADARIALLTDISESHRLDQLLQREQRLRDLGDMAARLVHQLRTPLSSAMLYLAQLGAAPLAPPAAGDTAVASNAGAERAARVGAKVQERLRQIERLIEGMLRYIQGAENPFQQLCLKQLVIANCAAMQPQFARAGAELQLDLPSAAVPFRGQREALDNSLSNLLDNALQSCTGNGLVCVSLRCCAETVELCVRDNGPGIAKEIREQIFDPWFSTRPHGTGLGLAVVASAARIHGGEVSVSEPANGGISFSLRLPLVQAQAHLQEPEQTKNKEYA